MSQSPIARYLDQLDRELRVKRAPRRRLLAEAADHLRASADDIATSGVGGLEAEQQAVVRFGAAAVVARQFAHSVATTSARTALAWASAAYVAYAAAALAFSEAAPSWLRDFPQGAPSVLALQVGAVAIGLSAIRALRYRKASLIEELRLRLIGNGLVVASIALAAGAGLELLVAATRPAAAPWRDAAAVIAIYTVAATAVLVAVAITLTTLSRTRMLAAWPRRDGDELPPAITSLVDDVATAAPRWRPFAAFVTSRPLAACAATAVSAFVVIALVEVAGSDMSDLDSMLGGAAATGLFEAFAVVVAYLALGRVLGLRAPRRHPAA